jgi:hypothetical protein
MVVRPRYAGEFDLINEALVQIAYVPDHSSVEGFRRGWMRQLSMHDLASIAAPRARPAQSSGVICAALVSLPAITPDN